MCRKRGGGVWSEGEAAGTRKGALNPGRERNLLPTCWERNSWALQLVWEGINSIFRGWGTCSHPRGFTLAN